MPISAGIAGVVNHAVPILSGTGSSVSSDVTSSVCAAVSFPLFSAVHDTNVSNARNSENSLNIFFNVILLYEVGSSETFSTYLYACIKLVIVSLNG